ncbi:MAG: hypothetical protein IPM66_01735 [Acidobacteriota bacterium]|nr:MAG: hypothetical protein IPM66_01735 [Acidobacteriota bacterium]
MKTRIKTVSFGAVLIALFSSVLFAQTPEQAKVVAGAERAVEKAAKSALKQEQTINQPYLKRETGIALCGSSLKPPGYQRRPNSNHLQAPGTVMKPTHRSAP